MVHFVMRESKYPALGLLAPNTGSLHREKQTAAATCVWFLIALQLYGYSMFILSKIISFSISILEPLYLQPNLLDIVEDFCGANKLVTLRAQTGVTHISWAVTQHVFDTAPST